MADEMGSSGSLMKEKKGDGGGVAHIVRFYGAGMTRAILRSESARWRDFRGFLPCAALVIWVAIEFDVKCTRLVMLLCSSKIAWVTRIFAGSRSYIT
jgi:hypothetical protein